MKRIPVKLDSQAVTALVPDYAMPLVMVCQHVRYRSQRVRVARAERDKGALSIEMAMLIIALVVGASLVVLAINELVKKKAAQIGTSDTSGQ
jgi:hypothetical protein